MGNYSGKERHGSSGPNAEPYETPPMSPYVLTTTTWSPNTQLTSSSTQPSKTETTTVNTPPSPQKTFCPQPISTIQNEQLEDCRTGPTNHSPEERQGVTFAPEHVLQPSGVCVKEDMGVNTQLIQECLFTLGLSNIEESSHTLNDLLLCFLMEREKMKEELRSCTAKIKAEREEWQQFQADLKVALVVSDRLRAEAEEDLSALRAAQQDWDRQLTDALQGRQEVEGQLVNLKAELEQTKQKLKQFTESHQGATLLRGLEREGEMKGEEGYGKSVGPVEKWKDELMWRNEMKGKREMRNFSTITERSRSLCRLPSDFPGVVVNGISQLSVTMTTESAFQSKRQASLSGTLAQQNNMISSIRDNKEKNSVLQTSSSSCIDVPNKINRIRNQEDYQSGIRLLRLHGSSRRNSLLRWCQSKTQGYKNIEITNFSSCWMDGLAFCAIYHSYLPSHIPYNTLSPDKKKENLALAFQTGESVGISATLTVEEMLNNDVPDWHRVLEYVDSIYRHFEM